MLPLAKFAAREGNTKRGNERRKWRTTPEMEKKDGRMKVGRDVVTVRAKSEGEERGRRERRERQKGERL